MVYTVRGLRASCVTGPASIRDCKCRRDGDYQNCDRCDVYSHCADEYLTILECAAGTFFDANTSKCENRSSTCNNNVTGWCKILLHWYFYFIGQRENVQYSSLLSNSNSSVSAFKFCNIWFRGKAVILECIVSDTVHWREYAHEMSKWYTRWNQVHELCVWDFSASRDQGL